MSEVEALQIQQQQQLLGLLPCQQLEGQPARTLAADVQLSAMEAPAPKSVPLQQRQQQQEQQPAVHMPGVASMAAAEAGTSGLALSAAEDAAAAAAAAMLQHAANVVAGHVLGECGEVGDSGAG